MQPGRFVRRLAQLAAAEGVAFREQERVASLDELEAEQIVIATDGSGRGLLPELADAVWHGNVLGFMCGELVASALQAREDPLLDVFARARLLVSG